MEPSRTKLTPLGRVVVPVFLLLVAAAVIWLAIAVIWPLGLLVARSVTVWSGPAIYLTAGLGAAGVLALLKGESPRWYGIVEIVFASGALAATSALVSSKDALSVSISYIGSVYVLIRGFTNVWQTLKPNTRSRIQAIFYTNVAAALPAAHER